MSNVFFASSAQQGGSCADRGVMLASIYGAFAPLLLLQRCFEIKAILSINREGKYAIVSEMERFA